jgi:pimeloyl-ACP methyl ester carboxylesterase
VVVLQHGFLGGSGYWTLQMEYLDPLFDIISPDLPGFAGSAHVPPPDGVEGFAGALLELLDELGVERFTLVGHSMGGMVAAQLALDHPERLERLVLYGTAATGRLSGRFETFEESIQRLEQDGIEATAERIAATWFLRGRQSPFYGMCLDAGRGASLEAAIACMRAIPCWDVSARLGEITVPTLVIGADRDRSITPSQLLQLWAGIKDAELCVAPGSAHNVHLEKPDLFNRVLGDFLRLEDSGVRVIDQGPGANRRLLHRPR